MILLDINGANAIVRKQDTLTSGMVGAKVVFCFDDEWESLAKTAVFRAGKVVKDAVVVDSISEIPHEVLATPGVPLEIGVYGTADNGALVIPTVWARTNTIKTGADPSGDESVDPSLPVWAQIQEQIGAIYTLSEETKETANNAARFIGANMVIGKAEGESIYLNNAAEQYIVGLRIFGKTTQDGVPTPDTPAELVSHGDSGSITATATAEGNAHSVIVATPNGLRGIPVASGGNYTATNGQQWICDEINFDKGVYIQRIGEWVINGDRTPVSLAVGNNGGTVIVYNYTDVMKGISTKRLPKMCDKLQSPTIAYPASYKDCEVGRWSFNTEQAHDTFLVFNVGELGTAEDAINYLKDNPITFIGILATPIETALSEEELTAYAALRTYRDNTTISNDASAHMKLEYVMDAKKYIDSLFASATGNI